MSSRKISPIINHPAKQITITAIRPSVIGVLADGGLRKRNGHQTTFRSDRRPWDSVMRSDNDTLKIRPLPTPRCC